MGLIKLNVFDSILFHIDEFDTPKEIWDKLQSLFGQVSEFRALQLEAELTSLSPNAFPSIDDFIVKFKSMRSQLVGCGKSKNDKVSIFLFYLS